MTIREELEKLGPEAVRRGMVAFEHAAKARLCPDTNFCCFLTHAALPDRGVLGKTRQLLGVDAADDDIFVPAVEDAFEHHGAPGREALRQECIAFLAEHGDVKEIAPVREVVSGSAVVQQEATQT